VQAIKQIGGTAPTSGENTFSRTGLQKSLQKSLNGNSRLANTAEPV
jgi:hypothetical protein